MNIVTQKIIKEVTQQHLSDDRKQVLQPLIAYIQNKRKDNAKVLLNFICTHNSRRSHLAQIWAQTMAHFFGIPHVYCYSGGTEQTAVYPQVLETLRTQGFEIHALSESNNPVFALKYEPTTLPVVLFSKEFYHPFNPQSGFAAIMTCSSADKNCPVVSGAENRFSIQYDDPKLYDNTPEMAQKYCDKSLEIAREMGYVFSLIKNG